MFRELAVTSMYASTTLVKDMHTIVPKSHERREGKEEIQGVIRH
jgi:hypothetical protein